jgi:AcrR family transcriptional regulator
VPTPTPPLSSRGRATRERLLTAARTVFEEKGFLDTRISHIAEAAGVAYGSFYTHFASKEAVFYEVADQLFAEMFTPGDDEAPADTPQDRLAQANRNYAVHYRDNAAMMAIIEQVATIDEAFRGLRMQHRQTTTDRTAGSIKRWQQRGLVPADVDATLAAQALGAMVDRTLYLRYVLGELESDGDSTIDDLNVLTARALGLPAPTRAG